MAGPKPTDQYNPVATVAPETSTQNDTFSVHATPEDMGAQVGQAIQKAGATTQELGQQSSELGISLQRMATEAKVSDMYANNYAPAAANLRANFDQLNDVDKVDGYKKYIDNLKDLNQQSVSNVDSPYGKQILSQLINRHIAGEIDGGRREATQAAIQARAQGDSALIYSNNNSAAAVYNDPQQVNKLNDINHSILVKAAVDNGIDVNTPAGKAQLGEALRKSTGDMATSMISSALTRGDAEQANIIRRSYAPMLPGYQQLYVDGVLHTENMRQSATQGMRSMVAGQPLPEVVGYPASSARAMVANTASLSGVNPNEALTVLQIETAGGRVMGARGTLGQDKASAGKPMADQAKALCDNYNIAKNAATSALGRQAQPWEAYTVYQQGTGGGAALLKADPNSKAVDAVAPFYKSRQMALSAIQDNGGNASMSASQFLQHLQDTWTQKAKEAGCNFSNTSAPGQQIVTPHQTGGPTMQPGATPVDTLKNWNDVAGQYRDKIDAMPLGPLRDAYMKQFDEKNKNYTYQAEAYKSNLRLGIEKTIGDPGFTDPAQLSLEQRSAAADVYGLPERIEHQADYNLSKKLGVNGKKFSPGYVGAEDRLFLPRNDPNAITDDSQLWQLVKSHDITKEDWKDLSDTLGHIQDPKGQAEVSQKTNAMNYVLDNIASRKERSDGNLALPPAIATRLQNARIAMQYADEDAIKEGRTTQQRYSPDSPYFIGNSAKNFLPTTSEKISAGSATVKPKAADDPAAIQSLDNEKTTLADLKTALDGKKISRATAETLAAKHKLAKSNQ